MQPYNDVIYEFATKQSYIDSMCYIALYKGYIGKRSNLACCKVYQLYSYVNLILSRYSNDIRYSFSHNNAKYSSYLHIY